MCKLTTNESVCNMKPRPQSYGQRCAHVVHNSRWRTRRRKGNYDFLLYFENIYGDQLLNDPCMIDRRLCDMDAEEFMMHGFDSDVSEAEDEPMDTENVSSTEVSQEHKK